MSDFIKKMFYKQRDDFKKLCAERDTRLYMPDSVDVISDISYNNDGLKEHRLDVYRPSDKKDETLPVIVNIHGGGLIMGNKEFNRYFCGRLCSMGFIVYSIEYCLVPEHNFFEQLNDSVTAMNYIGGRIVQDGGDLNHVYAVADSGGANLLVYNVALSGNNNMAKDLSIKPSDLHFNALGLISGMFYTTKFDGIGLFLPPYLYGKKYRKSPFYSYIKPDKSPVIDSLPPCYLVTSHNDNLQHYTLQFEKALRIHNIPCKLDNFAKHSKLTHAFSVFEPFLPESTLVLESMTNFLKLY